MKFTNPAGIHTPLAAYSHQATVGAGASWLVMSGQVGMDSAGAIPDDPIAQTETALDNILHNLEAAGMDVNNLVKLTFYFAGTHDASERRAAIDKKLGGHHPCMTVLYVAGLASPLLKVEIDAWACKE